MVLGEKLKRVNLESNKYESIQPQLQPSSIVSDKRMQKL